MTQSQLDNAIAEATGESVRTVHRIGFSIIDDSDPALEPENLNLYIDCPFCGGALPSPGLAGDGMPALAECLKCDVYFEFASDEVYAAPSDNNAAALSAVA